MSLASFERPQQGLPTGYAQLADKALSPNIFFEPAMLQPALQHLAPPGVSVVTATAQQNGQPIAALPVWRPTRRYGPLPGPLPLAAWHHPYSLDGTPLAASDAPETALEALFERLARRTDGPPVLLINMMRTDGPLWPVMRDLIAASGRRMQIIRQVARAGVKLPQEAVNTATLRSLTSKNSVQSVNKSRRKLATMGEVTHQIARRPDELAAALDIFLALEAGGWKGNRGTALATIGHDGFARQALRNLAASGRARIDLTMLERPGEDPQAIAGTAILRAGTATEPVWMPWKTAYDEAYTDCAPGTLTLADLTSHLLDEAKDTGSPFLLDSLAAEDSVIAKRLWRERWTLVDVIIDLKPGGSASFSPLVMAEKARQSAYTAGKSARAALRRAQTAMNRS